MIGTFIKTPKTGFTFFFFFSKFRFLWSYIYFSGLMDSQVDSLALVTQEPSYYFLLHS